MGYRTKVQSIKRKNSEQFYIGFPMQAARMLDLSAGEQVEWTIEDRETLVLQRKDVPPSPRKKKKSMTR
jgi:hypothetical protein